MRILLAILLSLGVCSAASASSGSPPPSGGHGGGGGNSSGSGNRFVTLFNRSDREEPVEEEAVDDPRVFTLPAVVAPLSYNGRLTGYAYVRVRVRAAAGQNIWTMQEHAHYALDAMVRAAGRISLTTADGAELDHELATEVWTRVLREYYGADAVDTVQVVGDDRRMFGR
tara:strand:+ start:41062 stop:41571 length:510 start_codon:yes stop_codon:yes gene_type:complete